MNPAKLDACGEGALEATKRQKSNVQYGDDNPEIVGQFMRPMENECFIDTTKYLTDSRKKRKSSGRTLKAGRE